MIGIIKDIQNNDDKIRMEVGIEDHLHIEF